MKVVEERRGPLPDLAFLPLPSSLFRAIRRMLFFEMEKERISLLRGHFSTVYLDTVELGGESAFFIPTVEKPLSAFLGIFVPPFLRAFSRRLRGGHVPLRPRDKAAALLRLIPPFFCLEGEANSGAAAQKMVNSLLPQKR